jgi:hypothetical protein
VTTAVKRAHLVSRSGWSPDGRLPLPARKLLKSVSETTVKAPHTMATPLVADPRAQGEPILRPIPGGHAGVPMFLDEYFKALVRLLPPIDANPEVCVRARDRSASVWSFRWPLPAGYRIEGFSLMGRQSSVSPSGLHRFDPLAKLHTLEHDGPPDGRGAVLVDEAEQGAVHRLERVWCHDSGVVGKDGCHVRARAIELDQSPFGGQVHPTAGGRPADAEFVTSPLPHAS